MHRYDPLLIAQALQPFDFHQFVAFNDGALAVFRGDGVEQSDWEMHPDTDELLFVLEGSDTIEILALDPGEPSTLVPLTAGTFTVVPRGHWHRHRDVRDLIEFYFTPGTSLASEDDDPRLDGAVIVEATPPPLAR
jgi:mannose-6-phosphate isomerase-like protein (cupin superfamily)